MKEQCGLGLCVLLLFFILGCGGNGNSATTTTTTPAPTPTSAVAITATGVLSGAVSSPFSSTLAATGGTSPYTWSVTSGTLPAGIALSSAGALSGTPTAVGDTTVTVQVKDSSSTPQTATEQLSFAVIPAGFGTTPVLDEEFNESALNTSLWDYRTGVRDECTQDSSAVAVANGYLRLSTYTSGGTNHCGAIDTSDYFTHAYGYWEAAVRYQYQPAAQCAWWIQSPTNGSNLNDPQASGAELDVFEHTHSNTSVTGYDNALHWNGYGSAAQSLANYGALANLNDGNFHVFAVAWTPSGYTFYVDGQVVWTVSSSQAPASSAAEYIILDTELPTATGIPASGYGALGSSSNQYLDVDYVRVYPYPAQ